MPFATVELAVTLRVEVAPVALAGLKLAVKPAGSGPVARAAVSATGPVNGPVRVMAITEVTAAKPAGIPGGPGAIAPAAPKA